MSIKLIIEPINILKIVIWDKSQPTCENFFIFW